MTTIKEFDHEGASVSLGDLPDGRLAVTGFSSRGEQGSVLDFPDQAQAERAYDFFVAQVREDPTQAPT